MTIYIYIESWRGNTYHKKMVETQLMWFENERRLVETDEDAYGWILNTSSMMVVAVEVGMLLWWLQVRLMP